MNKIDNPYVVMLERLHVLDRSIHILTLVNNDLRHILHKHKPLPQFIHDSFKRTTVSKLKTSPALPPVSLPPTETEEMRLAASVIDKAKRTIENVGEKKSKQSTTVTTSNPTLVQANSTHNHRPKTASSVRPSSASSAIPVTPDPPSSQPPAQQSTRRYVPAHMKAPFLTQPEKKRRPDSSIQNIVQANANPTVARRSLSRQRRPSTTTQSIVEIPQQVTQIPTGPSIETEKSLTIENQNTNGTRQSVSLPDCTSMLTMTEEPIIVSNEPLDIDILSVPQPIILNRALVKPLRRLWKQNQNLRLKLKREFDKKSSSSPPFINRLNKQIHSSIITENIRIPNIEVLLQLAIKLRSIVLYLLENSTFDDLDSALKRLNTLKYLVNQYQLYFTSNIHILVAKQHQRSLNTNINIDEWLNKSKSSLLTRNSIRYTDDSQLIAFTEVRFKQFENECRWIELNWHEQMIIQFKQSISNQNQNPLQIYRELMSLVSGLQTSTPIVVENRLE